VGKKALTESCKLFTKSSLTFASMPFTVRASLCYLVAGATFLSPIRLQAQTNNQAIDRSQLFRTQPGVLPGQQPDQSNTDLGYAAPSANDQDLGIQAILKRQEQYKAFTLTLEAPYYWTSNVALTNRGEVSDGVFAPAFSLIYQPHIWQTLYGEIGVAQQLFYYNRYSDFNFGSFDAIAGVVYYLPQLHDLALRLRYDFNRLTDDNWNEFFSNHQIILIAELPFRFGRAMQLSIGGVADISVAGDPQEPRRNEFDAYVGYQAQLTRSLSIDAAARVQLKDYYEGGRTDVSEILALTANYRVRDWLIISALSSFVWNQSNHDVFDYQVVNLGGAVALTIRF
jgi:hypothetical protein